MLILILIQIKIHSSLQKGSVKESRVVA